MGKGFDLETAIAAWRHPYEQHRVFSSDDLDELESNVRDRIAALQAEGYGEEEALHQALVRLGSFGTADTEYRKVWWGKLKREQRLWDEWLWRASMFKNYVTTALRNLRRHSGYAFIHVMGLSVGFGCFILIGLFVQHELSYDTFHEKAERTFRIAKEKPGREYLGSNQSAVTSVPLARTLMEEFAQVEHAVQIKPVNMLVEYEDHRFYEDGLYATEHFFNVFSFVLVKGDPHTALTQPDAIILTESLARKYFGERDAVGQTLSVTRVAWSNDANETREMKVVGVVEDVPVNSHFTFDYLVSMVSSQGYANDFDQWDSNSYFTYTTLHPEHSLPEFSAQVAALGPKYLGQMAYYREHPEAISVFFPQPLTDIHLQSDLNFELGTNGDIRYVYVFSVIALLILAIACINYMNLVTATSAIRTREIGMRKILGAHRKQIVGQLMAEAVVPYILALLVAVLYVLLFMPTFNELIERQIVLGSGSVVRMLAVLICIGLGIGVVAGSYPAVVVSRWQPVDMMRGARKPPKGKPTLRNVLVVAQFAVTLVLIISVLVIQKQLDYIQSKDTGLDRDHVVSIEMKDPLLRQQYSVLKHALQQHPNVLGVSASSHDPTYIFSRSDASDWEGRAGDQRVSVFHTPMQYDFVDVLGIELIEGHAFSEGVATSESEGMLINETLKRQLGWDTAVGKWFRFRGREAHIIGVVEDFNFLPFHQEVAPLALYLDSRFLRQILVRVHPANMQETIRFLEESVSEVSADYPFEYRFLDDAYNQMYQAEIRLGSLFGYFSMLAVVIACLGLLGLAAFTTSQRKKEIGIRKVSGASAANILALLTRNVIGLVGLALVVGAPAAYWMMHVWLEDFAYRVSVGWDTLMMATMMVLLLALLTVSYQAFKAAYAKPVDVLQQE